MSLGAAPGAANPPARDSGFGRVFATPVSFIFEVYSDARNRAKVEDQVRPLAKMLIAFPDGGFV
jgi:hypothetical protein